MDTVTHIAVGNDAGAHFRRIGPDGWWHLCRPLHDPVRVTVPETLRSLDMLAATGDTPSKPTTSTINVWPAKWRHDFSRKLPADQYVQIPARRVNRARMVYRYARSKGLAAPFARLVVVQSIQIGQP